MQPVRMSAVIVWVMLAGMLVEGGCARQRLRGGMDGTTRQVGRDHPQLQAMRDLPGEWMVRTELYFGLGRADGTEIDESTWRAFVREEVTPRFPDGLTVLDGWGQWRQAGGSIRREPSRVLLLIYPASREAGQRVEAIRARYKAVFGQESVLRTDAMLRASF